MDICKFCAYDDQHSAEIPCDTCHIMDITKRNINFVPRYDIQSMMPPCYGMYRNGKEDCYRCTMEIKKACRHTRKERGWERE